jgi:hypothetical protein
VQLRFQTGLTSEEYVTQQGWLKARLDRCPLHPGGGCGFSSHGSYARKQPIGTRVARWYCKKGQMTFSLLPDCLAARLPGTLQEVEAVVAAVEAAPSVELAVEPSPGEGRSGLRSDIDLPGAIRWTWRRVRLVRAALTTVLGLLPNLLAGCEPTIASFRSAFGAALVLTHLREIAAAHLSILPPPLGFGPRPKARRRRRSARQQRTGPDPPRTTGYLLGRARSNG